MISPSGTGGTLQYAHNLCNALARVGHTVTLATALECEMAAFPRQYHLLGVFDRFRPHPGPLWRFIRHVRRMQPDIIHFQGAQRPEFYALLIRLLSLLCRARLVWTPQDILSNRDRPAHRRWQARNYARMAHVFLNARQNEAALRDLYAVPPDRITVLPLPDLVAFARDLPATPPPDLTLDPRRPLILCFGLIEPRKGIATLIEAFGTLGPAPALLVFGKALTDTAPYARALEALNLPPGQAQILPRYAGFTELNWAFAAATVVVLPYVSGWNSGVLASAYGFGKPVIATRVGGFEEVVKDNETGLLVPPQDAPALAAALARLLKDPHLQARLAAGAAAAGAEASWPAVARATEQVYEQVLADG